MFRFPWGDFHSLNLGWFLQKFKELLEDWATAEAGIDGALDAEIQKAEDALTDVFSARDAAAASASAANSSALNASQSSLASMDARDQSRAARDAAQQAATNAAASETAAGDSATEAENSATAAAGSATAAGNSATAAAGSATAAGNSATAAAGSATAAGNSATAAAGSATNAEDSADRAQAILESIPSDYSDLSAEVTNIENILNANSEQTFTYGAGYRVLSFPISAGVLYSFENLTTSGVGLEGDTGNATYVKILNSISPQTKRYFISDTNYTALRSYFNTSGSVKVTRIAEVSKILQILKIIAPYNNTDVAERNYNTNDIIVRGAEILLITSQIAQGTFFSNSNSRATTLGEIITSILNS